MMSGTIFAGHLGITANRVASPDGRGEVGSHVTRTEIGMDQDPLLDQVMSFHGHFCPGLLIGYRAALAGLHQLGVERAADEQLVAIAETDVCGVDAVQYVTGCTVGKGEPPLPRLGQARLQLRASR